MSGGLSALAVIDIDGEPRVLDTDLGEHLGFAEPRMVRNLIKRHIASLEALGVCYTVALTSGASGGRPGEAFHLNKRQAVFITAKSDTSRATEITIEVINRFDEYERGVRQAPPAKAIGARDVHSTFRAYLGIAKLIGLDGNQAALSANRATIKRTGVDPIADLEASLIAETQEELLIATVIGTRLGGISARQVNQRLAALGFHMHDEGPKNLGWLPTEKGQAFGQWLDVGKRQVDGTPVRQWKWFARIIDELRASPPLGIVDNTEHDGGGAA